MQAAATGAPAAKQPTLPRLAELDAIMNSLDQPAVPDAKQQLGGTAPLLQPHLLARYHALSATI